MSALDRQGDCESLLAESADGERHGPQTHLTGIQHSWGTKWLLYLLYPISLMVGCWLGIQWSAHHCESCSERVSQTSPLLADISISYDTIQFNGSFEKETIFRQDASPEVDAAWEALGIHYRSFVLRPEEALKAGIRPDQVQVNEKYGGGFIADLEGLHHLHCLNYLRKSLHYNYEYYHPKEEKLSGISDKVIRHHTTHCLDILRQQLMCAVDIEVFGRIWVHKAAPTPFFGFNSRNHVCRDFDAVRRWAEARQLPDVLPGDYLRPPGPDDVVLEEFP